MACHPTRRDFIAASVSAVALGGVARSAPAEDSGAAGQAAAKIARPSGSHLKVSCCAYSYHPLLTKNQMTMEQFVDRCAELNLDGAELTSYYFPKNADRAYFKEIRRRAYLNGLDVSGTAVGNVFTLAPGPARDKQTALVRTWIDNAVEIGAPCVRVFAGEVPKGTALEQARRWCIECLEQCLVHAAERGVFLALENHLGIVTTSEQLLACIEPIRSPWFGVNLDTGNFREADPYAAIAKVAPYAVNVHLKTEVTSTVGGASPADYARIMGILRSAGYRGYVSLEYEAKEDPRTGVPKHLKAIQEAVGKV